MLEKEVPTLNIGKLILPKTACLAPMAGVADRAFREICRKWGACYVVGEMASAKGMHYSDKKTAGLLEIYTAERPMAAQLFGDEPEVLAEAALLAMKYNPDVIDINMGCPAPKIAGNGAGSALMKNPELASQIIKAVVKVSPVPVTVKFRKGWDNNNINAIEFAKMAEEAGVAAIAVHGRTRQQMYAPPVDIDIIRQVKEAVSIPVIGNGDIVDIKSAVEMYEKTGCDLVMIGRGALGSPWIFKEIESYLTTGVIPDPLTIEERMVVMREHIILACTYKGEGHAMKEARKHIAWYIKGLKGAAGFRRSAGSISTIGEMDSLIEDILRENT